MPAPAPRLDVAAASAGEWHWYVLASPDTTSAVEREGEWRVYYETLVELLNSEGVEWSGDRIARMDPPKEDDAATNEEAERAAMLCQGAATEIEIDGSAEVSRADDALWVRAWVRVPYLDEGAEEESFWPGDEDHATRPAASI